MNAPETPDHLAKSPVVAGEAKADAIWEEAFQAYCDSHDDPKQPAGTSHERAAATILRHFQPVLAQLAQADGKVEAMREAGNAAYNALQSAAIREQDPETKHYFQTAGSKLHKALTPGAGERTTL